MPAEKKSPTKIDYAVLDAPRLAYEFAASATKDGCRLHPSAITEFSEYVSSMVARGLVSTDPVTGAPLSGTGHDMKGIFEDREETRPHSWMKKVESTPEDQVREIWESGNKTLQAQRYTALLEQTNGNATGAMAMWREEQATYLNGDGGKPRPGQETIDAAKLTTNPWSEKFNGTEKERAAKIASICRMGTKLANDLAKAAGTTIGRPLTP